MSTDTDAGSSPASDAVPDRDHTRKVDAGPIYVAGADRSGTTLMFALLASHPDVSMVRRTNMWRWFHRRYGDLAQRENLDRCLSDMVGYRRMRHLQPDADQIREEFLRGEPTYGRLFALFHLHHAERAGKLRWGDKSLGTELHADRVFSEFPDARIVQMIRDPRDRYASVRRRYERDLSRVAAATARWLQSARAGRRNARRHPGRYLLVRYEDLATQPEATMRRVCDFVGLDYRSEMLSLDGVPTHRDSGGNSSFGDLEPGAISTRAIGRFRTVLSASDQVFIDLVAGRALAALGYERHRPRLTPRERLRFLSLDLPVGLARAAGWTAVTELSRRRGERLPPRHLSPPTSLPVPSVE